MFLFDTRNYSISADRSPATDSDQRYTPDYILEKIDRILGGIGLDPTADPSRRVKASYHITEREDCFVVDWEPLLRSHPTAWMNPPYSNTAPFLARWCEYVRSGAIDAGITLTLQGVLSNKSTQPLIKQYAKAIVLPLGRINFIGSGGSNDRDVVFILWGKGADAALFDRELGGMCVEVRSR